MSRKPYRVHIGYTATGRDRWRYYNTLENAQAVARIIFKALGVLVAVEKTPKGRAK
jgi:hypothetical protein